MNPSFFDTTLHGTPVRVYSSNPNVYNFILGPSFVPTSSSTGMCYSSGFACRDCAFGNSDESELCISAVKRLLEPELKLANPELFL